MITCSTCYEPLDQNSTCTNCATDVNFLAPAIEPLELSEGETATSVTLEMTEEK